jgi:hypothetical protein
MGEIKAFVFALEFRGYGEDIEEAWEYACEHYRLIMPPQDKIKEDPTDPVIPELQRERDADRF